MRANEFRCRRSFAHGSFGGGIAGINDDHDLKIRIILLHAGLQALAHQIRPSMCHAEDGDWRLGRRFELHSTISTWECCHAHYCEAVARKQKVVRLPCTSLAPTCRMMRMTAFQVSGRS